MATRQGDVWDWGNVGAVDDETSGPLSRFRQNRQAKRDARDDDGIPPGYELVKSSDIQAMTKALQDGPNPAQVQKQAVMAASQGGGGALFITPAAPGNGASAALPATATTSYPFPCRRYRIRATGQLGGGIQIASIMLGQVNLINGSPVVVDPQNDELVIDLAAPVMVPTTPCTVTAAGATGIAGSAVNYTVILEP